MYEGMFLKTDAPFAQLLAPARKFNALVVENAEKVAEFQINAARSYTDIGLRQFRDALQVNDVEGLRQLVTNQSETSRMLAAKLLADTQALVNLGQIFGKEVQKLLVESGVPSILSAAAENGATGKSTATSASRKPT